MVYEFSIQNLVCPDGMHPRQTCRRLFVNDVDMLENAANTDSCPLGYRCVTYGSPYVGHCCRLRCPYGEPDLRFVTQRPLILPFSALAERK